LHSCNAGPFKVLQWVDPNIYVIYFDINSTFNIENLVVYQKPHPIPNDPFEMPPKFHPDDPIETFTPFTLTSAQKDNIDAILDEQLVLPAMVRFNGF